MFRPHSCDGPVGGAPDLHLVAGRRPCAPVPPQGRRWCAYFLSVGAAGLPLDAAGNGEREVAAAFGLSCLGFFGSRPLRF